MECILRDESGLGRMSTTLRPLSREANHVHIDRRTSSPPRYLRLKFGSVGSYLLLRIRSPRSSISPSLRCLNLLRRVTSRNLFVSIDTIHRHPKSHPPSLPNIIQDLKLPVCVLYLPSRPLYPKLSTLRFRSSRASQSHCLPLLSGVTSDGMDGLDHKILA